jgi:predicted permease
MAGLRRLLLRLFASLRVNRAEDDLSREVQSHLALLEDDYRSRGLDPAAARLAARRAFGGVEQVKEHQRDARAFRWISDARRDTAYACRTLARTPGFAAIAVATLALGIGTTTTIFSLFDAVLLRPLAVDRPGELRVVRQVTEMVIGQIAKENTYVPYRWFVELRPRPEVFTSVMAFAEGRDTRFTANARTSRLAGGSVFVSDNYFDLLGVGAAAGRTFTAGRDDAAGRAVVLGHALWQREFGGGANAVGAQVQINDVPFTVIGVAPAAFSGLEIGQVPDVFLPIETMGTAQPGVAAVANRDFWMVQVIGRLQPGLADEAATERLTTARDFMAQPPPGAARHRLQVLPVETGLSDVRERFAKPLSLMLGMGALLLLIACANVATLLGARAASRRPEIVIRTAIGAGKSRIVRQLLTESLVLAAIAGAIGALSASWSTRILLGLLPETGNPLQLDVAVDRRVLLFTITVSLLTALVAGLIPAVRSLGFDLAAALRDRSRGGIAGARGRSFAVVQVALSMILVVASAMFARTVYNLATLDTGFEPEHLIQMVAAPGERQYEGPALERFYVDAAERLRALPGVRSVSSAQLSLLEEARTTGTIAAPGSGQRPGEQYEAQFLQVGAGFFATTGMKVLRGRDFSADDVDHKRRVAAINEAAARQLFGDSDPVGQTLSNFQVIGVVRGAKYNSLRDDPTPVVFIPYTITRIRPRMTFLVRTAGGDEAVVRAAGSAVRGSDPLIPIDVTPMQTFVDRSIAQERLLAILSIAFAASALLLLSIGLYGIMTFWVTERTPDIGIHLALGAKLSHVQWVVIRQPLWLAAIGIGIGLPAAVAGSRVIDSLMFGVEARDPMTMAAAVIVILLVTIAACMPAARRAARVDPMTALRCE